jgi:hypothetical protein
MAIRYPPYCPPPCFVFESPNRAERLPGCTDSRRYLAGITVRGVNQDETQPRIATMKSYVSCGTHHVVIGVGHHKSEYSTRAFAHPLILQPRSRSIMTATRFAALGR